jgi:threonine dehydrogenase-like Zn-dependent dehydrogenase
MVFPIGKAMNRNLTVKMGNCPHRRYIPDLIDLVESGTIHPSTVLTQIEPLTDALEAFRQFDLRRQGWIKIELVPAA